MSKRSFVKTYEPRKLTKEQQRELVRRSVDRAMKSTASRAFRPAR